MVFDNTEYYHACRAERDIDTEFFRCASTSSVDKLRELISAGANPDAPVYNEIHDDYYAIHQAALNPDIAVLKYIISLGVDPCKNDFWINQPLAFAVRHNPLEFAKYLVGLGNEACRCNYDGVSVLANAALNPHRDVLDFLFENGADVNDGGLFNTPLDNALRFGTPERVKYFIDHGADLQGAMVSSAWCSPLENLQLVLENGFDPNALDDEFDDDGMTRIIDHLDPKRRALFERFGGKVANPNAEKSYCIYTNKVSHYIRYGIVEYEGRRFSLCEDPSIDNAPELCPKGMALAVNHTASVIADGFYPCATVYFADEDYQHPVDVTEGLGEVLAFNPTLHEFRLLEDFNERSEESC